MKIDPAFPLLVAFSVAACSPAAPPADLPPPAAPIPEAAPVLILPKALQPPLPTQAEPKIFAASALVVDAITGRVLYQKKADEKRAVASTQKLLSALVVHRSGPLDDPVTITANDVRVEPSVLYLKPGQTFTRQQLVKGLLVKSGNDVAKALARDVAGSEKEFVALMNRTAQEIGMAHSHFKNPHGLTEPGQHSTARDLAILAREVRKILYFRECMKVRDYQFVYPDGKTRKVRNTNEVLHRFSWCTGMKTGNTRASGRCLISSADLNGRSVIAVVLGSKLPEVWKDSEKLLRYGLNLAPQTVAASE